MISTDLTETFFLKLLRGRQECAKILKSPTLNEVEIELWDEFITTWLANHFDLDDMRETLGTRQ
jgi:hypothetical protein